MRPPAPETRPPAPDGPRPWERLGTRLAALFAVVTLLAVGLVGAVTYQRQQREVEDTVGTQLLNIARVTGLVVDPALHAEVQATGRADTPAYRALRERLVAVKDEVLLTSPIHTLTAFDPADGSARLVVATDRAGGPGDRVLVAPAVRDPLRWTFEDGVARYTGVYADGRGRWISAFAPIPDARGRVAAVVAVDYPVEIFLDRLHELRAAILSAAACGLLGTVLVGLLFARRLTRPIRALTAGVARVADGDVSAPLPVTTRDELGQLTRAFNGMLEGLRQRDFIRSAFGRYVSPEVARQLLESPEGLRFGGTKRTVTVLMSDLRGYTRFAEQGAPERVMAVLNAYLARMTDVVVRHGGTINEFIGDAIFAVFGAPIPHADHAERAARCALAMQHAMGALNAELAARGLPRFEMGIGVNTGEAVVGNIGSERRAKYAVVGSAVNVAARVEGATVGGQVFVTAATWAAIAGVARAAAPLAVQMKGLADPVVLHELLAIAGGPEAGPAGAGEEAELAVPLPLTVWRVEDKVVLPEPTDGLAVRLGRRGLLGRLTPAPAPLTNVRLRLRPAGAAPSGDIYGKVVGHEERDGAPLARVRFTALSDEDARAIEALASTPAGGAP